MEQDQVKETGTNRLQELRAEAKELGITGTYTAEQFEALIKAKKDGVSGLTVEEAAKIDARMKYEEEAREKFRRDRQKEIERADLITQSGTLGMEVDLPENPTELQLAEARSILGIAKKEVKPSPETLGIEAGKRGYYIFTNLEQDDASHTVNPGGKYTINLIPDQILVLSEYHIKLFRRTAIVPTYGKVETGVSVEGQMGQECKRTGGKQRFAFEYLGEAPEDAQFGLVTNMDVLSKLKQEQLS